MYVMRVSINLSTYNNFRNIYFNFELSMTTAKWAHESDPRLLSGPET